MMETVENISLIYFLTNPVLQGTDENPVCQCFRFILVMMWSTLKIQPFLLLDLLTDHPFALLT